jgi:hypothetical protein
LPPGLLDVSIRAVLTLLLHLAGKHRIIMHIPLLVGSFELEKRRSLVALGGAT